VQLLLAWVLTANRQITRNLAIANSYIILPIVTCTARVPHSYKKHHAMLFS